MRLEIGTQHRGGALVLLALPFHNRGTGKKGITRFFDLRNLRIKIGPFCVGFRQLGSGLFPNALGMSEGRFIISA
ncbi:hypothetical protein [Devosia sp.]|uniref:hypothetical protein n=1 Tax=Devosia sp. TaxID=1871048 RepID=UPI0032666DF9